MSASEAVTPDAPPVQADVQLSETAKEQEWGAPNPALMRKLTTASLKGGVSMEEGRLPPAWISEYLTAQGAWAAQLLQDLIKGDSAHSYDKLNAAVINSAEGLAFIQSSKGGFGLTMAHGYGFLIKKLEQDQYGNSKWSQPLFFSVSQGGLGFAAGYQHTQSVIALLSLGSVDVFKNGITSLGTDLGQFSTDGALVGISGGAALGNSQHLGLSVTNTRSAFCYSKVGGAYLELGMHLSRVAHDTASNSALYGDGYTADTILSSAGQYVTEMLPLLRTINRLGKQALGYGAAPAAPLS